MVDIACLRVEIDDVEPRVVRRVEVPLAIRLDDLHFVLQIAIGWQNCHPFGGKVIRAAGCRCSSCDVHCVGRGRVRMP